MGLEHAETHISITIAEPTVADCDAIINVRKQTWIATYPNIEFDISKEDIQSLDFDNTVKKEKLRKQIVDQIDGVAQDYIWVARDGNTICGMCVAGPGRDNDDNELHAVYVLPEYQGYGIGKKLMHTALDWLGKNKNIYLWVTAYNKSTIDFYGRFGFKITEESKEFELQTKPKIKKMPLIKMIRMS